LETRVLLTSAVSTQCINATVPRDIETIGVRLARLDSLKWNGFFSPTLAAANRLLAAFSIASLPVN